MFKHALKDHIDTIHSGEQLYSCDLCSMKFSNEISVKHHIDETHKERKYECDRCGKNFSRSYRLRKHITQIHEGKNFNICKFCAKFDTM